MDILAVIAHNYQGHIALPSDWDIGQAIPHNPRNWSELEDPEYQDFLLWATDYVAFKTTTQPITVELVDLIQLYRENGGSWCRAFGIKGSWKPGSWNLLSLDRIDSSKVYEKGNLMILLCSANRARNCNPNDMIWHLILLTHRHETLPEFNKHLIMSQHFGFYY